MLQLIDDVFATRSDPGQLQVTGAQIKKLNEIHPATLSEVSNEDGPLIWVLIIPTTKSVMNEFLKGTITEKELLDKTRPGDTYDCMYLCSVTTLPEARGKGETRKLCLKAIREIAKEHPINTLFAWPFTKEGNQLSESLAKATGMELLKREG
ncbi:MAG: GCN5-related N-acetyltransferase (GNAT)-like protein [Bacteroidetes bacterium]|nr:GCN5-related N-acetyltransferase (GNAT)-like protein [Bacteroidota bacterium]